MINKIYFSHYKPFNGTEEIEVRPITLIVGKNSSGKSSILKLFPMFSNMLSMSLQYPLLLCNNGISLGSEYADLFHKRSTSDLKFALDIDDDIHIAADYYQSGDIALASISTQKGDKIVDRDLASDKSMIRGLLDLDALSELGIDFFDLKQDVNYIGPFRVQAPHNVVFQGFDNLLKVGYNGEGAYNMLLNSYKSDKVLLNNVSAWMKENMEGQSLEFTNIHNNNGSYGLMVVRDDFKVNANGVGQGLAQVLPIIVQSYIAGKNSINVLEQPALHLHPAAHSKLAQRLAMSAIENKCRYVIESHSENMLLGFRYMVANPEISFTKEDLVIYFVTETHAGTYLKRIEVDENGDLSEWPTGVFGEAFDLLCEINKFRK